MGKEDKYYFLSLKQRIIPLFRAYWNNLPLRLKNMVFWDGWQFYSHQAALWAYECWGEQLSEKNSTSILIMSVTFTGNNLVVGKCFIFSLLLWWILVHLWILNSFGTHVMLKMFFFFFFVKQIQKTTTSQHLPSTVCIICFFLCNICAMHFMWCIKCVTLHTGHTVTTLLLLRRRPNLPQQ